MKKGLYISLSVLLSLFLLVNIISSQTISPLYSRLVYGEKAAAIEYLMIIRKLPIFIDQFNALQDQFGQQIASQVFAKDSARKAKIQEDEDLLQKNPNAVQVLLQLSILYKEEGNQTKSLQYFQKAQSIDPTIK